VIQDKTRNPLPMAFRVYNEQRIALYTSPYNSHQGSFDLLQTNPHPHQVDLPDGGVASRQSSVASEKWSICIENGKINLYHPYHWDAEQAEKNAKLVSMSIAVEPKDPPGFAALSHEQKTQQLLLGNIAHKFDDLLHQMNNMHVREAEHRNLAEQTYSALIRWTIVLFLCLVVVSVGQVLSIMRFFQMQKKVYY
jgi:hypothetical protein